MCEIDKKSISVIFPVYNNFDYKRLIMSVKSALCQKGINVEAVVVESNLEPTLEHLKNINNIKYVFLPHDISINEKYNTGLIRNYGVAASSCDILYLTDADIVFTRDKYLKNVVHELCKSENLILYKPFMRRLLIEFIDEFWNKCEEIGVSDAIKTLNISQEYVATMRDCQRPMVVSDTYRGGNEGRWTCSFKDIINKSKANNLYSYSTLYYSVRHYGGTILRKKHFYEIGGFSSEFYGWGSEDYDLHWKLSEKFNLDFLKEGLDFEVIHLDHDKPYFTNDIWRDNKHKERIRKKWN